MSANASPFVSILNSYRAVRPERAPAVSAGDSERVDVEDEGRCRRLDAEGVDVGDVDALVGLDGRGRRGGRRPTTSIGPTAARPRAGDDERSRAVPVRRARAWTVVDVRGRSADAGSAWVGTSPRRTCAALRGRLGDAGASSGRVGRRAVVGASALVRGRRVGRINRPSATLGRVTAQTHDAAGSSRSKGRTGRARRPRRSAWPSASGQPADGRRDPRAGRHASRRAAARDPARAPRRRRHRPTR